MKRLWMSLMLWMLLLVAGCSSWEKAYEEAGSASLTVMALKGPGALGLVKAMEPGLDPPVRLGDTVYYSFEEDEATLYAKLSEGKADIAVVPTEIAAKLYHEGAGYQLAAVNTGGYLYMLSTDNAIKEVADLRGKVITIAGEKSRAEVVIRRLLERSGLNTDADVTLTYASSSETAVENAANSELILLAEPWVSDLLGENDDFAIALDIQDEWMQVNGNGMSLPLTCLIVKKEIPIDRAEEWGLFVADYKDSIDWINSNPAETTELVDKHEMGITKEQAEGVISRSNLIYLDAASSKSAVEEYLNLFLEANPDAINGSLPDDAFYLEQE